MSAGAGMVFFKMLVPIGAFHAHPFLAVTARHGGNILTAFKTQSAIVANSHTLGTVFFAIRANLRTVGAGLAIGTDFHTFAAHIAVVAKSVRTFAAHIAAVFADHRFFTASRAVRAMKTV